MNTRKLLIVCATLVVCSIFIALGISGSDKAWDACSGSLCIVIALVLAFLVFRDESITSIIRAIRGDDTQGDDES